MNNLRNFSTCTCLKIHQAFLTLLSLLLLYKIECSNDEYNAINKIYDKTDCMYAWIYNLLFVVNEQYL